MTTEQIIKSNPSLFDLHFKDYVNGNVVLSDPTERAINEAEESLQIFKDRQEAIYARTKIAEGDWVILRNGDKSRVTVADWDNTIQVGGYSGGSYHLNSNGTCSYSGGCGDPINRDELVDTGEYMDGKAWIFHRGQSGANRGVTATVKFKVWEQVNTTGDN